MKKARSKRQLTLFGLPWLLIPSFAFSAESPQLPSETDPAFRPAIVRIELDCEKVGSGKTLKIQMDWRANRRRHRKCQLKPSLAGIGRPPDFSTTIPFLPPARQWTAGERTRGQGFTIAIPADLAPDWRRMRCNLTEAPPPDSH